MTKLGLNEFLNEVLDAIRLRIVESSLPLKRGRGDLGARYWPPPSYDIAVGRYDITEAVGFPGMRVIIEVRQRCLSERVKGAYIKRTYIKHMDFFWWTPFRGGDAVNVERILTILACVRVFEPASIHDLVRRMLVSYMGSDLIRKPPVGVSFVPLSLPLPEVGTVYEFQDLAQAVGLRRLAARVIEVEADPTEIRGIDYEVLTK